MGEIADWLIEGGGCEWCGEIIGDGSGDGFPRLCYGCREDARKDGFEVDEFGIVTDRPDEGE